MARRIEVDIVAIQITSTRVFVPVSSNASVTATRAASTGAAIAPTVNAVVPAVARPFYTAEELLHDAGGIAADHNADMLIPAVSFRAILTASESNYLTNHHSLFLYYATPYDLVNAEVEDPLIHAQTHDNFSDPTHYRATMASLVSLYTINNMYLLFAPEWDNNPGNRLWATNRFLEAGGTNVPNGLTRQAAYDQWNHYYLANNHNGNNNHQQLGQILQVPLATRGYKTCSMNVYLQNVHYSYEQGVDMVIIERNNDDISGIVGGIAQIRGAGTQYGKNWGIDLSQSRTYGPHAGVTSYDSSNNLIGGWSNSCYRKHFYLSYFAGADLVFIEGIDYSGQVNINGRFYIPLANEIRSFNDFAMNRHTTRGVAHVPVAVMKDHISAWEPRYGQFSQQRAVWYLQMPANAGEHMMYNLWDLIYPNYSVWATSTSTTEPWGSGRWGEQFDVITERATAAAMGNYKAVILSNNTVMDATLQAKLATFAQNGGIVIINAKQLTGTAHESLTGVHLVGTAAAGAGTVTWDGSPTEVITESAFNYTTCTLVTATNLAHSGASTTQVARNVFGAGEVWTVMPDWMSNTANNVLLALGSKIIDVLIANNARAWITGVNHSDIDYCITKQAGASGAATVVCIANCSNSNANWTGTINFPGTATPVREWVTDTTPSFTTVGGNTQVSGAVLAGDVRVYAVG